jgi:hypothetical protein
MTCDPLGWCPLTATDEMVDDGSYCVEVSAGNGFRQRNCALIWLATPPTISHVDYVPPPIRPPRAKSQPPEVSTLTIMAACSIWAFAT